MAVADVLAGRNLTLALPDALDVFPKSTPQQQGGGADLSYGTFALLWRSKCLFDAVARKPTQQCRY